MRSIYVITHAQSVHHIEGLSGGWYDTGLTDKGHSQAEALADFLFGEIGQKGIPVYASDLLRAAETAEHIAGRFGSTVISDSRLRETTNGDGDRKTREWLDTHISPMPDTAARVDHRIFPNGETRRETGERIAESMNEILRNPAETVVIVTHGFALTFVILAWFGIPAEYGAWGQFRSRPASVTLLREDEWLHNRNLEYLCKEVD